MIRTPLIEKILNTAETNKILVEKLLDGYEKGEAEGESINITDSANLPMILRPQGQIIQDARSGYNLLPLYKYIDIGFTKTINGITITVLDGFSIKVTGKRTSNVPIDFYIFGQFTSTAEVLKLNGVYTFLISENPYTGIRAFLLHNSNICLDTNINNKVISEELENITVSALLIRIETDNELNEIIYPMLYEGSEEKEYEEYGKKPSTIFPSPIKNVEGNYKILNRNKNYFNFIKNVDKQTYIGITTSCYSNKMKINGTSIASGTPFLEKIPKLKKGKYKVSIKLDINKTITTNNQAYAFYFRDVENRDNIIFQFASNVDFLINRFSKTLNLDDDKQLYASLFTNSAGITFNDMDVEFQIEKIDKESDEATEIIEPQSQNLPLTLPEGIKLYGKEDGFVYLTEEQATELELDGEGWYVYNKWKEYVATGNENWVLETNVPNTNGFYQYRINNFLTNVQSNPDIFNLENGAYCNYFPKNTGTINNTVKEEFTIAGSTGSVVVNSVFATVEEFKAWLQEINTSEKPFKIVYLLENPIYTKITDKNFIKQLEELQKVFAYEGVTNIDTYSTDDKEKAPLIISAEYLKSQKTINKDLDERITNLEALLLEQ